MITDRELIRSIHSGIDPLPDFSSLPEKGKEEISCLCPSHSEEESLKFKDSGITIEGASSHLFSPAGLDLTFTPEVYVSDTFFNVNGEEDLRDFARKGEMSLLEIEKGGFLLEPNRHKHNFYYFITEQKFSISDRIYLEGDSKSSAGRLGVISSHVTRGVDPTLPSPLVFAVQPVAFPLFVRPSKTKLFQVRFRYEGTPYMFPEEVLDNSDEIKISNKDEGDIKIEDRLDGRGVILRHDISTLLRARDHKGLEPIDFDSRDRYKVTDYFEEIKGREEYVIDPYELVLSATLERIALGNNVCGVLSREDVRTGNGLWGHLAGVVWPGYHGRLTMELFSDSKRYLSQGDEIAVLSCDRLEGEPNEKYLGGFNGQKAPSLGKQFSK